MSNSVLIIAEQVFLYFPLVLGAYISISLMKLPDLSIESAYVFGAILATKVLPFHEVVPSWVLFVIVLGASLLGGLAVGSVSSFLREASVAPMLV